MQDLPRAVVAPTEGAESDTLGKLPERLLEQPWAVVREEVLAKTERAYLDSVLRAAGGVIQDTAKQAGISPRSLYDKMKRHDLDKDDYR